MIAITYSRAEGTLADGTSKGDAAGQILYASGFRWGRSIDMWFVRHSRGKAPDRGLIQRARAALEAAGYEVSVSIDAETVPDAAAREAERNDRADGRAEYFSDRADRHAARSDSRWEAARAIRDHIPVGQPVLVGHHSEGRHRRALARADNHERASFEENRAAKYAAGRARAAESYRAGRENLGTTLRRIERLEVDIRRVRRALATDSGRNPDWTADREADVAQWEGEVSYWKEHIAAREAAGEKVWGPGHFAKGDQVRFHGTWWPVLRVNKKSVTIPHIVIPGDEWTYTLSYDKVEGQRRPSDEGRT